MSRRDDIITSVRDAAVKMAAHDHGEGGDLFCLNLSSWVGENARPILEHVDALEQEIAQLREERDASREAYDEAINSVRAYESLFFDASKVTALAPSEPAEKTRDYWFAFECMGCSAGKERVALGELDSGVVFDVRVSMTEGMPLLEKVNCPLCGTECELRPCAYWPAGPGGYGGLADIGPIAPLEVDVPCFPILPGETPSEKGLSLPHRASIEVSEIGRLVLVLGGFRAAATRAFTDAFVDAILARRQADPEAQPGLAAFALAPAPSEKGASAERLAEALVAYTESELSCACGNFATGWTIDKKGEAKPVCAFHDETMALPAAVELTVALNAYRAVRRKP